MARRQLLGGVLALLAFVAAGSWVSAQLFQPEPIDPPVVVSGPEVGFRMESRRGGEIYGRLVVRIDGAWVEVNVAGPGPLRRLGSN